jgi:hypothetical protein
MADLGSRRASTRRLPARLPDLQQTTTGAVAYSDLGQALRKRSGMLTRSDVARAYLQASGRRGSGCARRCLANSSRDLVAAGLGLAGEREANRVMSARIRMEIPPGSARFVNL